MINYEELQSLAGSLAVPLAVQSFPQGGDSAVRAVLRACKQIFAVVEPSQLQGPVIVFSQAQSDSAIDLSSGRKIVNMTELLAYVNIGFALEINSSTTAVRAWPGRPPVDVDVLRTSGVVFVHDSGNEEFLISNAEIPLPRVFAGPQSFFSVPNYATLDDALAFYRQPMVRLSHCDILQTVWHDSNRLFLKEKPEDTIQRSLLRYLRYTLRNDAEVMREQKVNDTNPVDIRVTFQFANRVALIEVKWMGKSKHPDGSPATQWAASRAIDGAHQLAGYLDGFSSSSPSFVAKGYLVVLDARRRMLSDSAETISTEHGMYYADREIDFPLEYRGDRADFNEPLRMFAEPICL